MIFIQKILVLLKNEGFIKLGPRRRIRRCYKFKNKKKNKKKEEIEEEG
jgi:hypothetical protein